MGFLSNQERTGDHKNIHIGEALKMTSTGVMLPICLSQYLVVYDRGFDENGSWRGYYQSFETLGDAYNCSDQVALGSYGYVIYDLVNSVVVANVVSPEALFQVNSTLQGTAVVTT